MKVARDQLRRVALVAACGLAAAAINAAPASAARVLSWGPRIQVNYDPLGDPNNNTNTNYSLDSVSCTTPLFCAAVESHGKVFYSTNPGGGSSAWKSKTVDTVDPALRSVSCAPSLCVVGDGGGYVTVSTNPAGSSPTWAAPVRVGNFQSLNSMSCPTAALCVGAQGDGVVSSTDPAGGASKWTGSSIDAGGALVAVSCPTTSFCEAVDNKGNSFSSTNPTGGSSAWKMHSGVDVNPFQALSCPSSSLCVAVDSTADGGNIATSSAPAADTTWSTFSVEPAQFETPWSVSCPTVALCVMVDDNGNAFDSTNPTGGKSAWSTQLADARDSPTSVSCASAALCVLVGTYGNAYVGKVPLPNTSITGSSVSPSTHKATFRFAATGGASGFQCELRRNGAPASFSTCSSPTTYSNLTPGSYTFLVRAFNLTGPDPTPATVSFTLAPPPDTKLTGTHISKRKHSARFSFKAIGTASGFQCELHKKGATGRFSKCSSPKTYKHLGAGRYMFLVRALGAAGPDPTPASFAFRI